MSRWTHLPARIHLTGVLVGDVWVCAGSSNMAMPMSSIINSSHEISSSLRYRDVRFSQVAPAWTEEPQLDLLHGLSLPWQPPTYTALSRFSATCWMFGTGLHVNKNIPIGVVGVYVADTELPAWSSAEVLRTCNTSKPVKRLPELSLTIGYWKRLLEKAIRKGY